MPKLELLVIDPVDRLQFAEAFRWVNDVRDALMYAQPRKWQPAVVETPNGAVAVLRAAHLANATLLGDNLHLLFGRVGPQRVTRDAPT